jgi:malate dehydrogenase (oxaloacetate-decarboxylating)
LQDQTVVMLGAGSAGNGVCEQIVRAMVSEGLDEDQARSREYVLDILGLLVAGRPGLDTAQRRLAQPPGRLRCSGPEIPSLSMS